MRYRANDKDFRAAFERYAKSKNMHVLRVQQIDPVIGKDDDRYISPDTSRAWSAWCAAGQYIIPDESTT